MPTLGHKSFFTYYPVSYQRGLGVYWKMFMLFPILFYPPFVFVTTISIPFRVVTFIIMVVYIFLNLKGSSFKINVVFQACIILLLFFQAITVDFSSEENIRTALSFSLTLVFALVLSRAIRSNFSFRSAFFSGYVVLFFIISSSVILAFFSQVLFSMEESNLFSIPTSEKGLVHGYEYTINVFGLLLPKTLRSLGIDSVRSFSYFIEPVYIAPYLAVNFFLVYRLLPNPLKNRFKWFNGIAGILTISFVFPVVIIFLYVITNLKMSKKGFYVIFVFIVVTILTVYSDLFAESSINDRLYRMTIFLDIMESSEFAQYMFGKGFFYDFGFEKSISAGFFQYITQMGIVGAVMLSLFVLSVVEWNWKIFLFSILIGFTVEPLKTPFFWTLLFVLVIYFDASVKPKPHR